MTATLAIIIGVVGLLLIVGLILWYVYRQGKKVARLAIMESAYRDRDKIEKKTDEVRRDIDRDLPRRVDAARERVSGKVRRLADEISELYDPDGT